MDFYIAWGALALLALLLVVFIVGTNLHARRVSKALTPEERKKDDEDTDTFIQTW